MCEVAFSDDENTLVTLSEDGRATAFRRLRDSLDAAWLQIDARAVANPSLCSVALSPAGDAVFVPRGDSLRRWSVEAQWADSVRRIVDPHDATQVIAAHALRLTDDGELSALGRDTIHRWRATGATAASERSGLIHGVMYGSFYAYDLGAQLNVSSTPTLALADGTRVELSLKHGVERAWLSSVARTAVIVSRDEVLLVDFAGNPIHSFPSARGAALVHDDQQLLVATSSDLERWALGPSPARLAVEHALPTGMRLVAASDDGRSLALLDGSNLELARVASDGQLALSGIARDLDVVAAQFSRDGTRLVTTTAASVTCWDLSETPVEVYTWTGRHAAWAASPSQRWLAISRDEGAIEIYDLSLDNLVRRACAEAVDRRIWRVDEAPCHANDARPAQ